MDFVYTEDIARANILAADSNITEGVYNIASQTETSLNDLAKAMLRAMDSDLPIEYLPPRAVNGVVRRLADTSAARRDLGFFARVSLDVGLRRLVEWWAPQREAIAAGRKALAS
jgi:UDP-glucose 4-epimerase